MIKYGLKKPFFSVVPFLPLLMPRLVTSIGFESAIYGVFFLIIFITHSRPLSFRKDTLVSYFCAMGWVILVLGVGVARGHAIDYKVFTIAATALLFVSFRPSEKLLNGFYYFSLISVFFAVPMSFFDPVGFVEPASTYEVLGIERITFFFNEPSHYSIVLALSYGIGIVAKKTKWMQAVLLAGIAMTVSGSGIILLIAVHLLNKRWDRDVFFALSLNVLLLITGFSAFLPFLLNLDSSNVIQTRIDQVVAGASFGFSYSSTGLRVASLMAGLDFIYESFRSLDFFSLFIGVGFDGLKEYTAAYYQNFFLDGAENELIFNFFSIAIISGGIFGLVLYLGVVDNVRQRCGVRFGKWLIMIFVLSLTHGYLYGPLALILMFYAGFSISKCQFNKA